MASLFNLIRGAVDYAGLFPPAGLPIEEVVANYATYFDSDEQAMLGRLIIPAARLSEFETTAGGFLPTTFGKSPWRISALVPPIEERSGAIHTLAFDSALEAIESFNENHRNENSGLAIVDSIEVKTPSMAIIHETINRIPAVVSAFCEIPHESDPGELIQGLAQSKHDKRLFAKIRTGGVTPELIPSIRKVARFITHCAHHDLGFKATAGLHHPIRATHRLTYEVDSPTATMHGFLNVFFAAAIAFTYKVNQDVIEEILANMSPSRFVFSDEQLAWGERVVSSDQITEIRNSGIISFGSCSFTEPTLELQQLPDVSYETVFAG